MSANELTQKQRASFESQFNEIVSRAPKEVQVLWVANGITWIEDTPHFHNNIHFKFNSKLWNEYLKLDYARQNGMI